MFMIYLSYSVCILCLYILCLTFSRYNCLFHHVLLFKIGFHFLLNYKIFLQLLGGEVYHYHSKYMLKDPNMAAPHYWHQDYGYVLFWEWKEYALFYSSLVLILSAISNRSFKCWVVAGIRFACYTSGLVHTLKRKLNLKGWLNSCIDIFDP